MRCNCCGNTMQILQPQTIWWCHICGCHAFLNSIGQVRQQESILCFHLAELAHKTFKAEDQECKPNADSPT